MLEIYAVKKKKKSNIAGWRSLEPSSNIWKEEGESKIGHRVKSNCDVDLDIFGQLHQELCSIYGPSDLSHSGPKWLGLYTSSQAVIGYGLPLEGHDLKQGNFLQLSHYLELLTAEATSPSLQGLNDTSLSQP